MKHDSHLSQNITYMFSDLAIKLNTIETAGYQLDTFMSKSLADDQLDLLHMRMFKRFREMMHLIAESTPIEKYTRN